MIERKDHGRAQASDGAPHLWRETTMSDVEKPGDTERAPKDAREAWPPAGPHAKPHLTNPDATPGAGALPDVTEDGEADPGGG